MPKTSILRAPKPKKNKNKKLLKRIDKQINRLEKMITKLHQTTLRLQNLKVNFEAVEKAA